MKNSALVFVVVAILLSVTSIRFPFSKIAELETQTFELYPTDQPGVFKREILSLELFSSVLNVEGKDVKAAGYLSLERFVWVELHWETETGKHKVTLDSIPPRMSYEHTQDNIELFLTVTPYGISVHAEILGQHKGLPTLTLAFSSSL